MIKETSKSRSVSLCLCCHRDVCSGPLQAAHRLVRLSLRVSGDFSNKAPLQLSVPGNCLKSASVVCGLFCCGVFLRRHHHSVLRDISFSSSNPPPPPPPPGVSALGLSSLCYSLSPTAGERSRSICEHSPQSSDCFFVFSHIVAVLFTVYKDGTFSGARDELAHIN